MLFQLPNHSLERTQPQRDFMYDVGMLRRSARGRSAAGRKCWMLMLGGKPDARYAIP